MKIIFLLLSFFLSPLILAAEMNHSMDHSEQGGIDHDLGSDTEANSEAGMQNMMNSGAEMLIENIEVRDAYVRGLPPGVPNTSAYMIIKNTGSKDVELIGGQADFVESVTLHSSENNNGMMSMVHMMAITIPAGEELVLESGGLHLMLSGLKGSLGDEEVTVTLRFKGGLYKIVYLPIISVLDE